MKLGVFTIACLSAALIAGSAAAHHSFAMFDRNKTTALQGVVKEFQWTNPHSWVQMNVVDARGQTVEWSLETGSIQALSKRGWKRNSMKAGDKAEVTIHPRKDGSPGGELLTLTINGVPLTAGQAG